jgi:pentatricopeptide repeat protein
MICRRQWTTRLENSIRLLSPTLGAPLVHGVISGAAAAGRADLALQFFRFAYRRAGFRPGPATFDLLVPTLASRRMLNHARCLVLETMPSFPIEPDEATLASLIAAYGKAAIPPGGRQAVPDDTRPRHHTHHTLLQRPPTSRPYSAADVRLWPGAPTTPLIADGITPDLSTYNTLIWGFGLCRKMEAAVRVFGDMKDRGVAPDVTTYNTLLNAWVGAGDLESARNLFDEMARRGDGKKLSLI